MPTIIFHPGIGKTGTTAIQRYAKKHLVSEDSGINLIYSPIGLDDKDVHNSFADNHPTFNPHTCSNNVLKLIEFAKGTQKNVLVSSEFLIRSSAPHIRQMLETIRSHNVQVKVVVSIRNYVDYLISSYLQAIKVKWGMKPGETLAQYSARELQNVRMTMLVDQWARVIGDNNVYIFDYDKHKNDLLNIFFSALAEEKVEIEGNNERVNSSIRLSYANTLLAFDNVSNNMQQRADLIALLNRCSFELFDESQHKREVQNIVKNQYSHDVERLQARYNLI